MNEDTVTTILAALDPARAVEVDDRDRAAAFARLQDAMGEPDAGTAEPEAEIFDLRDVAPAPNPSRRRFGVLAGAAGLAAAAAVVCVATLSSGGDFTPTPPGGTPTTISHPRPSSATHRASPPPVPESLRDRAETYDAELYNALTREMSLRSLGRPPSPLLATAPAIRKSSRDGYVWTFARFDFATARKFAHSLPRHMSEMGFDFSRPAVQVVHRSGHTVYVLRYESLRRNPSIFPRAAMVLTVVGLPDGSGALRADIVVYTS